jgi:hypothetical protein
MSVFLHVGIRRMSPWIRGNDRRMIDGSEKMTEGEEGETKIKVEVKYDTLQCH